MSFLYVFFGWKTWIHNYFTFELCICNMREPNWQPPPFLLFFAFHRSLSFFRFQGLVATTQRCVDLKPEVSGALTGTSFRVESFWVGRLWQNCRKQLKPRSRRLPSDLEYTPKNLKNKHPSMKMVVFMMFFHKFPHTQWMSECVFFLKTVWVMPFK